MFYIKGIHFTLMFVFWCVFYSANLLAASLSGTVKVAESLEPLAGVNVFLANTNLGCSSDPNGYFAITFYYQYTQYATLGLSYP